MINGALGLLGLYYEVNSIALCCLLKSRPIALLKVCKDFSEEFIGRRGLTILL